MATTLWHPGAKKQIFRAKGKLWRGGSGRPKFLFHTTETSGFPRYLYPPHMTLDPDTTELRQHIPFNRAAYAIRSGRVDTMRFVYQIEVIGRARQVPLYHADPWYTEVAKLIQWFHDNFGVPLEFEDFSVMRFGPWAKQRRNYATVDAFSGVLGHAHVGRGIDTHWDPGRLNVLLLKNILETQPEPPPPPPNKEDEMSLKRGDKGKAVTEYQEALQKWNSGALPRFGADGDFGGETATWVGNFQKAWNLSVTQIIDGVTSDLLGKYHPDRGSGSHPDHPPKAHKHSIPSSTTGTN